MNRSWHGGWHSWALGSLVGLTVGEVDVISKLDSETTD